MRSTECHSCLRLYIISGHSRGYNDALWFGILLNLNAINLYFATVDHNLKFIQVP